MPLGEREREREREQKIQKANSISLSVSVCVCVFWFGVVKVLCREGSRFLGRPLGFYYVFSGQVYC